MPFIGGQPYSSFRAVNNKDGKMRLASGAYGGVLQPKTLTADRTWEIRDKDGTIALRGAGGDMLWGTMSVTLPAVGAGDVNTTIITIANILGSDVIFAQFASSSSLVLTGITVAIDTTSTVTLNLANPFVSASVSQVVVLKYLVLSSY